MIGIGVGMLGGGGGGRSVTDSPRGASDSPRGASMDVDSEKLGGGPAAASSATGVNGLGGWRCILRSLVHSENKNKSCP